MKSLKFVPLDMDIREHYALVKIQVDEMYRKYRWQVAPDGVSENEMLYGMATESKKLLREIKDAYEEWEEVLKSILKKIEDMGGTHLEVDEVTKEYLDMLIGMMGMRESVDAMVDPMVTFMGLAYKIGFYHQKFVDKIDPQAVQESRK